MWLQNKRDVALERSRPPSHRREDQHEFRVGRLKHERVKVPRGDEVRFFFAAKERSDWADILQAGSSVKVSRGRNIGAWLLVSNSFNFSGSYLADSDTHQSQSW